MLVPIPLNPRSSILPCNINPFDKRGLGAAAPSAPFDTWSLDRKNIISRDLRTAMDQPPGSRLFIVCGKNVEARAGRRWSAAGAVSSPWACGDHTCLLKNPPPRRRRLCWRLFSRMELSSTSSCCAIKEVRARCHPKPACVPLVSPCDWAWRPATTKTMLA